MNREEYIKRRDEIIPDNFRNEFENGEISKVVNMADEDRLAIDQLVLDVIGEDEERNETLHQSTNEMRYWNNKLRQTQREILDTMEKNDE